MRGECGWRSARPRHERIAFGWLEGLLDLPHELLRGRPDVAEYADGDLRVAQHLLDHAAERDDGALVVVARPQVQAVIRVRLHLPAALVEPHVAGRLALA